MIGNKFMWYRFRSKSTNPDKKIKFNLYKEMLNAERAPFLFILGISILIGVLALFGAYFQRYLFAQLIDP